MDKIRMAGIVAEAKVEPERNSGKTLAHTPLQTKSSDGKVGCFVQ